MLTFSNVVGSAKEAALASDAKALYTEYVAAAAEKGEKVEEEICVKIDGKYYMVKNGQIQDANNDAADGTNPLNDKPTGVVIYCDEHVDGNDEDKLCDDCKGSLATE